MTRQLMNRRPDQIIDHARDAAQNGDNMSNPYRPGCREFYEWEDAYKDARKADGKDYHDGTPPGCPAWG